MTVQVFSDGLSVELNGIDIKPEKVRKAFPSWEGPGTRNGLAAAIAAGIVQKIPKNTQAIHTRKTRIAKRLRFEYRIPETVGAVRFVIEIPIIHKLAALRVKEAA